MVDLNKVKPSDLWYTIGYIVTDGSLSKDGRHINITSKDREHLFLIRDALFLTNNIGRKTRGGEKEKRFSQLQIGDVNFYRYLVSLGVTQRKSLTIAQINIDTNYFVDFLRGVVDGDGNISSWVHRTNHNSQWCLRIFSASPVFIQWLNNKIKEEFNIEGKLYSRKMTGRDHLFYHLKFGKIGATKILQKIYYSGCLALNRKLLKVQLCLQL